VRLRCLQSGHRLGSRLILRAAEGLLRTEMPDVVRAMLYRAEFFGRPFGALTQQLLRGPSEWSVGERELFAAYTSRLNQCLF
jgi:hypothetical protein